MVDGNRAVETTEASLSILEAIKELDGATVTDLVERTALARSTVYNHLQTLMDAEYVVKENNTYHVGLKLFHLGEYARTRKREYEFAREAVGELADRTGMEVGLNVEEHGNLITVFDTIGGSTTSGFEVGSRFYLHATASGKAILAELEEQRRDEIIDTHGLPQQTEHTITDRDELLEELAAIREQGYAVNREENVIGYHSIATAITYPDGRIFGGLAVGGPSYLLGDGLDRAMYDALFETAEEIETELANVQFR